MIKKSGSVRHNFHQWITAILFCVSIAWANLSPSSAHAFLQYSDEFARPAGWMAGPGPTPVSDREKALSQAGIRGVIVFTETDGNLYLYIGELNETLQLTFDALDSSYTFPRFSPDGRFLAYLTDDQSGGDLYVMDLETRASELVARKVGYWGNHDWAPDSKSIVFGFNLEKSCHAYDQDSTYGIWQYDLDTKEKYEILPPFGPNSPLKGPRFSFDGKWISFESYPCFSEGFQLHTMNMTTGEVHNSGGGAEADWSPVENLIAITSSTWGGGNGNLALTTPDLEKVDLINASAGMQFSDPNFSADGIWIALHSYTQTESVYISEEELAKWQEKIILLNLNDDRQLEIYTSHEMVGCGFVSWSPDGNQVIFYTNEQNNPQWYVYNLISNEQVSIPPLGIVRYEAQGGYLDWIPFERLPESYRTGLDPTPESYPTSSETSPEEVAEPTLPVANNAPQFTPDEQKPVQQQSISWIFYAGFLLVFVVILILIIWTVKQKK